MVFQLQDVDDIIRAYDEAGVKLVVVKQNRVNVPWLRAVARWNRTTFAGSLVTVRVLWCPDLSYDNQDAWRGI